MNDQYLKAAPSNFEWPRCPETERFIRQNLGEFLESHEFALSLARRMEKETSTEFMVWVDHLILPKKSITETELKDNYNLLPNPDVKCPEGIKAYKNPYADLPSVLLSDDDEISCAIIVDQILDFQKAHKLDLLIDGMPYSKYREMKIGGEKGKLIIVERRGTQDFIPDTQSKPDTYLNALESWSNRKRKFADKNDGMNQTLKSARDLSNEIGSGMAATAFLEAERNFWQSKNKAGQIQKRRQDSLGLGWANHDHHTFRSSRSTFPALIKILLAFGFKKRERFFAGAKSGWGAQVMEQPEAGFIIFADVDLVPEDIKIDFSSNPLPPLPKYNTVGLWTALHGESMLEGWPSSFRSPIQLRCFKRCFKR